MQNSATHRLNLKTKFSKKREEKYDFQLKKKWNWKYTCCLHHKTSSHPVAPDPSYKIYKQTNKMKKSRKTYKQTKSRKTYKQTKNKKTHKQTKSRKTNKQTKTRKTHKQIKSRKTNKQTKSRKNIQTNKKQKNYQANKRRKNKKNTTVLCGRAALSLILKTSLH